MKVLHVIGRFQTGGAEKLLLETIPLFSDHLSAVDLLLLDGTRTPFYETLEATGKCKIYTLGNSLYSPLNIIKIVGYLKKYDVVHVHLFPAMYFVAMAKVLSLSKVKLVFTEHNVVNRRLASAFFSIFDRVIYRLYSTIISVAPEVKDILIRRHPFLHKKIAVIENGINLVSVRDAPVADRKVFGYLETDKLLIMVARLHWPKDQDTLIKALKDLPEHYKLLLVGEGKRRKEIEMLISDLCIGDRVSLLGQRSDVYSLLKMSDLAVMSSGFEGLSIFVLETMACGIPLIASNVMGLNRVVPESGGVLFEYGDKDDLKAKILNLENEGFYKEVSYRQTDAVAGRYDINKAISDTLALYQEVIRDSKGA